MEITPIKDKNLAKLVKIQNPVNPGFKVQKPNPHFGEKPGLVNWMNSLYQITHHNLTREEFFHVLFIIL